MAIPRTSRATPAEVGLEANVIERLDKAVGRGLENVHAVLVAWRGEFVIERYHEGDGEHRRRLHRIYGYARPTCCEWAS